MVFKGVIRGPKYAAKIFPTPLDHQQQHEPLIQGSIDSCVVHSEIPGHFLLSTSGYQLVTVSTYGRLLNENTFSVVLGR